MICLCRGLRSAASAATRSLPVFDWTRTQLDHRLPDGSTSLVYYKEQDAGPAKGQHLTLPGWDASYTREELKAVVAEYNKMTEEDLGQTLTYFLERIIPVAAECDVNINIHEDDLR